MAVSRPAPRSVEYALDHKEYLNEILVREAEAARACEKKARQERSLEKNEDWKQTNSAGMHKPWKKPQKAEPAKQKTRKRKRKSAVRGWKRTTRD